MTTNASTVGRAAAGRSATRRSWRGCARPAADLLCKTNLLEYAAGSVNPAYGMTYNPRDPAAPRAARAAARPRSSPPASCDYALGTDTGGSIRIPAAYCGIVGLKPTFGLVPLEGVFPLSPSCDHVGTLTRTVAQTATLLAVLAGRRSSCGPSSGCASACCAASSTTRT